MATAVRHGPHRAAVKPLQVRCRFLADGRKLAFPYDKHGVQSSEPLACRTTSLTPSPALSSQHLVSQKKRRLIKDGFDLDLSYITDQIIAMGLPCTGKSAIYRNPQSEVIKFLERYHGGQYKVYNLCTRPKDIYDPEKFEGRVACFPFEDHGVPRLEHVHALTTSVLDWLAPSRSRVVCIHCLAGKGRTGLMVCAALMRLGIKRSAREAMAFYGELRMKNKKGVTQVPSHSAL
jgi:phosphatidylinositol-3,4,5-trisphosphate 3-phosphatase/dual-specificity protein phosphatase PTEN